MSNSIPDAYVQALQDAYSELYPFTLDKKTRIQDIDFSKKVPPVPKGCQEYFFSESGEIFPNPSLETVFSCRAINAKSAIKKFLKYKKQL